uniref:Calcyclin-binding protein n=2 Tax=Timema TaxID=61471 RepID=A0A7R9P9R9_TIMCA|nr:unnamed protein product [Timema californicum]
MKYLVSRCENYKKARFTRNSRVGLHSADAAQRPWDKEWSYGPEREPHRSGLTDPLGIPLVVGVSEARLLPSSQINPGRKESFRGTPISRSLLKPRGKDCSPILRYKKTEDLKQVSVLEIKINTDILNQELIMPSNVEQLQLDVEELNKFLVAAQRQRVKEYLISQIKSLQTEIASLKQASQHDAFCNIKFSASNKPSCYEVKLNNYAMLMVTLMGIDMPLLMTGSLSVVLHVNGLDNKNYTLPITNLLEEINKDQSYWKVKTDNVTVFLAKKNIGSKWTHMTCSEKKALDSKLPKMDGAGEDPSGGLMDMMKHMYETGDDEMKRTIAKAWTESREKQLAGAPMDF